MKARRSSVARLMVAVAGFASALAIARPWALGWGDPRGAGPLGELAPMAFAGSIALALAAATSGRPRRFFEGLATSGLALALAFWVAPSGFRQGVMDRAIVPVARRLAPQPSTGVLVTRPTTALEDSLQWFFLDPRPRYFAWYLNRTPFLSKRSQLWLGGLELAIAILSGLFAATIPPRAGRFAPEPSSDPPLRNTNPAES